MQIQTYYNTKSILHKLNPLVKIICLVLISILVLVNNNIFILFALFLFLLILNLVAKIPFGVYWFYLVYFILFGIFSIALVLLAKSTLIIGLLFVLRLIILLVLSLLFIFTTSNEDLICALLKLHVPYSFAFSLSFALRFLSLIVKNTSEVIKAQKLRGYNISLAKSRTGFVPIFIPSLLLLFKNAFDMSLAAEARGFDIKKYKTKKLQWRFGDFIAIGLMILFSIFAF